MIKIYSDKNKINSDNMLKNTRLTAHQPLHITEILS
jgi:hypothetical protein